MKICRGNEKFINFAVAKPPKTEREVIFCVPQRDKISVPEVRGPRVKHRKITT